MREDHFERGVSTILIKAAADLPNTLLCSNFSQLRPKRTGSLFNLHGDARKASQTMLRSLS